METIKMLIDYVMQNSVEIVAILGSIVACASAIAALIPTPKDDAWVAKVYKVVDWLALNVGKAKQTSKVE